jgi:hypothetical protein
LLLAYFAAVVTAQFALHQVKPGVLATGAFLGKSLRSALGRCILIVHFFTFASRSDRPGGFLLRGDFRSPPDARLRGVSWRPSFRNVDKAAIRRDRMRGHRGQPAIRMSPMKGPRSRGLHRAGAVNQASAMNAAARARRQQPQQIRSIEQDGKGQAPKSGATCAENSVCVSMVTLAVAPSASA